DVHDQLIPGRGGQVRRGTQPCGQLLRAVVGDPEPLPRALVRGAVGLDQPVPLQALQRGVHLADVQRPDLTGSRLEFLAQLQAVLGPLAQQREQRVPDAHSAPPTTIMRSIILGIQVLAIRFFPHGQSGKPRSLTSTFPAVTGRTRGQGALHQHPFGQRPGRGRQQVQPGRQRHERGHRHGEIRQHPGQGGGHRRGGTGRGGTARGGTGRGGTARGGTGRGGTGRGGGAGARGPGRGGGRGGRGGGGGGWGGGGGGGGAWAVGGGAWAGCRRAWAGGRGADATGDSGRQPAGAGEQQEQASEHHALRAERPGSAEPVAAQRRAEQAVGEQRV